MTSGGDDAFDSLLRGVAASPAVAVPARGLREGDVLAERFVVGPLAGSGGMGTVHRAIDRLSGEAVAVKVVATLGPTERARFAQEARLLADLVHPAVVRYVAHGVTAEGQPFLAMEWLEGRDLADRLESSGLDVPESIALALRAAEALAAAHARGVVHRDIKPSNLFLVDRQPSRVKVLDFGVATLEASGLAPTARRMTRTGALVGTVGYMSPEQATGAKDVDARSDVFGLGCVLFECLTGKPAFAGERIVAVLAKVLREQAPRLRALRPELPEALDDLVGRMLSKERELRPSDGAAVARELAAMGCLGGGAPPPRAHVPTLSGGEQRLVSVLLAAVEGDAEQANEIARRHGGHPARLANGVLLVTWAGATSDEPLRAARCALALLEVFPSARAAVATGRSPFTSGGPPGPVIDQAASRLASTASSGIAIDEVTAGFLGERFEVRKEGASLTLVGQPVQVEAPRTLLGKPTPCVGREKELMLLEGTLRECIDESVARAVLVTGPAGQGKSRLRHEFVAKARERGDAKVLTARADPVGAGSAFVMARQLVRDAVGLREGDPAAEQYGKVRAYVSNVCKDGDSARIADFLGELTGVPSTEQPSVQLRAARSDAQIMAIWLGRSFGEWLAAECKAKPLLVVLEDLHWGDLPSVAYLGEALRALEAQPLMILALARPEVHETFPSLWATAGKTEVTLGRLSPRAGERLVRAVLGDSVSADAVARVVQRADGNAFFLEELTRRVAEGDADVLPETVIALVQSRLERLEPEARRVVRAAAVFGEVFWAGGVARLLGEGRENVGDLDDWLKVLVAREVLASSRETRFPAEREYAFRHGLLREAAYAMLTEADRVTGHGLAGDWLERAGEKDALAIAEHFDRGREPERALRWLVQAAKTACDGGNIQEASALADRALACAPDDGTRGHLRVIQVRSLAGRGDLRGAAELAREASERVVPGSTPWFHALSSRFIVGMLLDDANITLPVLQTMLATPTQPEPSGAYASAVVFTCLGLGLMKQADMARSILERAEAIGRAASEPDPVFVLRLHVARAFFHSFAGETAAALSAGTRARPLLEQTGDPWSRVFLSVALAFSFAEVGHIERADAAARDVAAFPQMALHGDYALCYLAHGKVITGRDENASTSLRLFLDRRNPLLVSFARGSLALALVSAGKHEAAVEEATRVLESASMSPEPSAMACAVLGTAALRGNRPAEALSWAERGFGMSAVWWSVGSLLHLTRAEALHALGRTDDARDAIRQARERILSNAATLEDPELRSSYTTNVVANARTLALAKEWVHEE